MLLRCRGPTAVLNWLGVRSFTAARLRVTSGRLVACDAVPSAPVVYEQPVPGGEHLVHAFIADDVLALLVVEFVWGEPASWVLAERARPERREFRCAMQIDCGMAVLVDESGYAEYSAAADDRLDEIVAGHGAEGSKLVHDVGPALVCFTGYGDGGYRSYIGLSGRGDVMALVLDFGVVETGF